MTLRGQHLELGVGGDVSYSVVDGARDVFDVAGGEAAHVDASALQQVDVVVLNEVLDLSL